MLEEDILPAPSSCLPAALNHGGATNASDDGGSDDDTKVARTNAGRHAIDFMVQRRIL
jgi:hypothetical protein